MFILAHYLQHLDICRLTIKTHLIQKQQESLSSYFKTQKDGVLIFFNESQNSAQVDATPQTNDKDSFDPKLMLENSALSQIIGADIKGLEDLETL